MLLNTSWTKNGNKITILQNDKLNYNGTTYPYHIEGDRIKVLNWSDKKCIVENGKLNGWEEELPQFNPYYFQEWQRFLYTFFRHHYSGDENIEKGEIRKNDPMHFVWCEWKNHYLNENQSTLISPRNISLRFSRSPSSSPLSSPRTSRGSFTISRELSTSMRVQRPIEPSPEDNSLRLKSSPGRCQSPRP